MAVKTSQITSLTIVYSTVYSGADQRQHQRSASLAFVWGIHRWPVNSPHKGPVTQKMLPFDDVIMECPVVELKWLAAAFISSNQANYAYHMLHALATYGKDTVDSEYLNSMPNIFCFLCKSGTWKHRLKPNILWQWCIGIQYTLFEMIYRYTYIYIHIYIGVHSVPHIWDHFAVALDYNKI